MSCSTSKSFASEAAQWRLSASRISFSSILPFPFLVTEARPLRAIARWPDTPVKSRGSGNKARHASLHHCVEPDVRRDALPHLPHGVFRQARNLKVLLDTPRCGRGGQEGG